MLTKLMVLAFVMFAFGCGDRPAQMACPTPDVRLDAGSDTKIKPGDTGADTYCNSEAAGCPALHPGDIFVVRCKPMKFIINHQGKALYFPFTDGANDILYNTWRSSNDTVYTIRQSCFDALPVPSTYPGGVNFRPGSFVVKRPTSDQLYVILPGNTRAKITAQVAAKLYAPANPDAGANDTPIVIPDAFWPHLVNTGPDIVDVRVHPGMLFVVDDGTWILLYYADKDGSIRLVTTAGMVENHFQSRFVRQVPPSAISGMPISKTIDALIPEIDDPTQGG